MPAQPAAPLDARQRRAVAELLRVSAVADELGRHFAAAGHTLYLVGGSVRDALLERLGADLDFTTDARPQEVLALVGGWADATWETGIAFGTVGVQRGPFRLEITTFRADSYDRSSRKPEVTYGDSLEGDLARRDFTVNAMAVRLPLGDAPEFADPYGGLRDLGEGVLRTPGRPEQSFDDDPLRMLRAARFEAQLGFVPVPELVAAMRDMAARIDIVSAERVRDELSKLVLGEFPRRGLERLVDTGLADHVLPELPKLRLEKDEHHRHKDVYLHTLTVLEQAIALEDDGPDLTLRLAALLHDIGKPKTRSLEPGGKVSFHHHEVVGAAMARARLATLRYPKDLVEDVAALIGLHLRFHGYVEGSWTDAAVRRYVRDGGRVLGQLHKLVRSDCTTRNRRKAAALAAAYDDLEERIGRLQEEEDLKKIRPALDGRRIMEVLGIEPGPMVGDAYRFLLDLRMERGPMEPEAAVDELLRWARERGIPAAG